MLEVPVRIGLPHILKDEPEMLKSPMYATGYGLLLHATKQQHGAASYTEEQSGVNRLLMKMKTWVSDFF